jgi:hypothetical protein
MQIGGQGRFFSSQSQTAGSWRGGIALTQPQYERSSFSRSYYSDALIDKYQSLPGHERKVSEDIISTLERMDFGTNLSQKSRSRDDESSPPDLSVKRQSLGPQERLATLGVHISTVTLTLTWQSCPGKSLASNSFSAGPMSYRESMICAMFGVFDSVIETLVLRVQFDGRRAFGN